MKKKEKRWLIIAINKKKGKGKWEE